MAFCDMDDLMFYMLFLYVFTYTSMLYVQRRDKQVMRYKFSTAATILTIIPGNGALHHPDLQRADSGTV